MKNSSLERHPKEAGVALAIVSLVLLLLTVLIVSAHYTMISQSTSTANFRNATQAFYVSESGIQRTVEWFSYKYAVGAFTTLDTTTYPNLLTAGGSPVYMQTDGANAMGNVGGLTSLLSGTADSFHEYLSAQNNIAYPGSTLRGVYTVKATLLTQRSVLNLVDPPKGAERWRIESIGSLIGAGNREVARAENVAILETMVKPQVNHAVCTNVFSSGGAGSFVIDTYDSSFGEYNAALPGGGTNRANDASLGSYKTTGSSTYNFADSVGGQIDVTPAVISANSGLCGRAAGGCGTNYCETRPAIPTYCAGAKTDVWAGTSDLKATGACASSCPAPTSFDVGVYNGDGTLSLSTGGTTGKACFWFKELNLGGGNTFTIDNTTGRTSPGTLDVYINKLTLTGNGKLRITATTSSPVRLFVKALVQADGSSEINMASGSKPGNLIILMDGASASITVAGSAAIKGVILTQGSASVTMNNNSTIYGGVITDNFSGRGNVHFDRSLEQSYGAVFGFMPNATVRRIY